MHTQVSDRFAGRARPYEMRAIDAQCVCVCCIATHRWAKRVLEPHEISLLGAIRERQRGSPRGCTARSGF